jgi:hypothetical protein
LPNLGATEKSDAAAQAISAKQKPTQVERAFRHGPNLDGKKGRLTKWSI